MAGAASVAELRKVAERFGGKLVFRDDGPDGLWLAIPPDGFRWEGASSGAPIMFMPRGGTDPFESRLRFIIEIISRGVVRLATLADILEDVARLDATPHLEPEGEGQILTIEAPAGRRWKHTRMRILQVMCPLVEGNHPCYDAMMSWLDEGHEWEPIVVEFKRPGRPDVKFEMDPETYKSTLIGKIRPEDREAVADAIKAALEAWEAEKGGWEIEDEV